MTNLEFFQSLNYADGLSVTTRILRRFPLQYGTTLGLDGHPQIRPIEFKFEKDGALYFDTVTLYATYKELLAHPYLQICVADAETSTYLRVGGRVRFAEDPEVVDRCFEVSPVLTSQFGSRRELVVAYFLTDAWAEFQSFTSGLPRKVYRLSNAWDHKESQHGTVA